MSDLKKYQKWEGDYLLHQDNKRNVDEIYIDLERSFMKVYLIRYGEVNHNLYGLYNREDEDLNETGMKQAINSIKKHFNIFACTILNSCIIIPIFFSICYFNRMSI